MNLHQEAPGPTLIITGMHRSGTSYVASTLQSAGLFLGDRLLAGGQGNVRGYYENPDFVRLQGRFLEAQGLSRFGWTLEANIPVGDEMRAEAEQVISRTARTGPWGWKDPRSTLFLDFWAETVPAARFLFVFRAPWEVVDSLFRRGDSTFRQDPQLAVAIWQHYNHLTLDFVKRHPDRCLLADIRFAMRNPTLFVASVRDKLQLPLAVPDQDLFDADLFKTESKVSHRPSLIHEFFPQAVSLWRELQDAADLCFRAGDDQDNSGESGRETVVDYMLQDWISVIDLQRQLGEWEERWRAVRAELYATDARLEYLERSRLWKIRSKVQALQRLLTRQGVQKSRSEERK